MRLRAGLLGRVSVLAAVAATFAVGAPAASAAKVTCTAITGSGSSLQAIAQQSVWSKDWEGNSINGFKTLQGGNECEATTKVTYTATSSGKGLAEWGAKSGLLEPTESLPEKKGTTLDELVGTDVGPEGGAAGEIEKMDEAGKNTTGTLNGVVDVPVAQSAVSVIASLPATCLPAGPLTVNITELARAYAGESPTFEALFGIAGCTAKPTVFARSAASGTTAAFKRFLKAVETLTGIKFGGAVTDTYTKCTTNAAESESEKCWPNLAALDETKTEKGGELAKEVLAHAGSIGYADLADAIKEKFPIKEALKEVPAGSGFDSFIAKVPNENAAKEKHVENPEVSTGTEAAGASNCAQSGHEAKYEKEGTEVAPNEDWSKAQQENRTNDVEVYPLCTLTHDVFWEHYSFVNKGTAYSKEQYNTVFSYISWIVNNAETASSTPLKELEEHQYAPLPATTLTKAQAGVTTTHIAF